MFVTMNGSVCVKTLSLPFFISPRLSLYLAHSSRVSRNIPCRCIMNPKSGVLDVAACESVLNGVDQLPQQALSTAVDSQSSATHTTK